MTETKTCQYCGSTIPADADTCVMCGSPTTPPPPPAYTSPKPVTPSQPEVIEPEIVEPEDVLPPSPGYQTPEGGTPYSEPAPTPWLAIVVEILAGMIGFLGIGWMISRRFLAGILLLIGNWILLVIGGILTFNYLDSTGGLSLLLCCCYPTLPLLSGLALYLRSK
jgi:hypothetical protein